MESRTLLTPVPVGRSSGKTRLHAPIRRRITTITMVTHRPQFTRLSVTSCTRKSRALPKSALAASLDKPETYIRSTSRRFPFASASRPISHAVLVGTQEGAALLNALRHAWVGRVIAIRWSLRIAYYAALSSEHLIVIRAIPI